LPAAVTKKEKLFLFNPSHRLNDFPNWQKKKNKILKVLGKWNYHQARLYKLIFEFVRLGASTDHGRLRQSDCCKIFCNV
jgi:hypothetical protein